MSECQSVEGEHAGWRPGPLPSLDPPAQQPHRLGTQLSPAQRAGKEQVLAAKPGT